jgi:hypothetical protein
MIVITGLGPLIHAPRRVTAGNYGGVDGRIKSGHDGFRNHDHSKNNERKV